MTRNHCSWDSVLHHVWVTCSFACLQISTVYCYYSTPDSPEQAESQFHRNQNHLLQPTTVLVRKYQFLLSQPNYSNFNYSTGSLYFQLFLTWFTDLPAIYWAFWAYFGLNSLGQSFGPYSKIIFNFTTIYMSFLFISLINLLSLKLWHLQLFYLLKST
jgi:hypothetical protein